MATSCDDINLDFTHTFLPAVYILVFIIGFTGNCWGLKTVFRNWKKVGNINLFLLNLGVADLLYVFSLPLLVTYYLEGSRWSFGYASCVVTRFCFNLNLYGSIGFLTCICVYRYLGIVYTMETLGRIKTRHSAGICALVWVLVLAQILPDAIMFDKSKPNSSESCFDTTGNESLRNYLPYSIGWSFTGFGIPLLIIIFCYGHVAVVLATRAKASARLLKQRCLKLVIILVLLFSVCFIPYHVLRNLNLATRILKMEGKCRPHFGSVYLAHQVSRGLASTNSAINPLIYLLGNDGFAERCRALRARARASFSRLTGVVVYRHAQEVESADV
ncbi:P2Y purinoceptor 1-like [Scleropages formosus]|nr:P2Y purinoceptor 1-like [Scleropages formosus]